MTFLERAAQARWKRAAALSAGLAACCLLAWGVGLARGRILQQRSQSTAWRALWSAFLLEEAGRGTLPAEHAIQVPLGTHGFSEVAAVVVAPDGDWRVAFGESKPCQKPPTPAAALLCNPATAQVARRLLAALAQEPATPELSAWFMGDVIVRVTPTGAREALTVPPERIRETLLPRFLGRHGIPGAVLGTGLRDLSFGEITRPHDGSWSLFWLSLGAAAAATGAATWALAMRAERRLLLRRVGFLNQIVHEVRTPLSGAKLSVQIVEKYGPSPEAIADLLASFRRLERVFDDLVSVVRGDRKAELRAVSAREMQGLLREVLSSYPKATLVGEFIESVTCDTHHFPTIMRNLVSNGIRYGDSVVVTVRQSVNGTEVRVQDQGPGISRADGKRIFEEFVRLPQGIARRPDGLGLGLSIARRLAKECGARLELRNPGEKGACFALIWEKDDAKNCDR